MNRAEFRRIKNKFRKHHKTIEFLNNKNNYILENSGSVPFRNSMLCYPQPFTFFTNPKLDKNKFKAFILNLEFNEKLNKILND